MKLTDLEQFFESWAPRWTAWERDNVGVQVGRRSHRVQRILVTLDVTPAVVSEAIRKKVDTIVSHHPLLYRAPKTFTDADEVGRLALTLAEKRIALYSSHTNLDAAPEGVSFALAKVLGVKDARFLTPLKGALLKIAVFVPESHVEQVAGAMAEAGAGVIGQYKSCSFRLKGKGTFEGSASSNPFIGTATNLEAVEEIRLEMLVPRASVSSVVRAMRSAHPYEEVAYDLYALENSDPNYGMGAIGNLKRKVTLSSFLRVLKKSLHAETVRYTGSLRQSVQTVAVCGGSGSELLDAAVSAGADVLVTADIRYHTFHSSTGRIALVDAGHWETEHVVLPVIARKLREWSAAQHEHLDIILTKHRTNPIHSI
jgi:dinuclear metal center YbgI/SA1388 family protein